MNFQHPAQSQPVEDVSWTPPHSVLECGTGAGCPEGTACPSETSADSLCDTFAALKGALSIDATVLLNEPLGCRTTFGVGGKASVHVEPASERDLSIVVKHCADNALPWFVLGRGSNVLVRDKGVRGVVVSLAKPAFVGVVLEGDRMRCGGGARLKAVAGAACRQGLAGFEFLDGIPGTIGGALRMNAGAMGTAIFDIVESVRVMDREGEIAEVTRNEVSPTYRSCAFLRDRIAIEAVLRGRPAPVQEIRRRMKDYMRRRLASQPKESSAGCVFKNPPSVAAGRLIDEVGLKGARVGGASVSDVHANFLVNDGTATAKDILDLVALVKRRVKEARGIELETEVIIVGEE